jgi:hypothetical protein
MYVERVEEKLEEFVCGMSGGICIHATHFFFFIVLLVGGGEMGGIRGGESGRIGIHATHFFYFSPISPLNL